MKNRSTRVLHWILNWKIIGPMIVAGLLVGVAAQNSARGAVADFFPPAEKALTRIAFGSCNLQFVSQSHWDVIGDQNPDLWIWGGDNIYADKLPPFLRAREFKRLKEDPHYARFIQKVPVIGTWDDHDYGSNNTGKSYKYKKESQKLTLDFLDEPADSPRRTQEGIYTSYVYGPQGRQIRIILPDLRYFRSEDPKNGVLLGKTQWEWLEKTMKEDQADLTLFVSVSQVLNFNGQTDSWGQYPAERERLFQLMDEGFARGRQYLVLSGDRHMGEFSKMTLPGGRELVDITSSGLTHSNPASSVRENPHRVGEVYLEKNFGIVEVQWSDRGPVVDLQVHAIDGTGLGSMTLDFRR